MKLIDIHCHLGTSNSDGASITHETLKKIMAETRVDRAVVFPIDEADKGATYSPPNNRIAELARRDPALIPFGRVNPRAGNAALAEMERFASLGIRGVKLHPFSEKFGPEETLEFVKKAGELELPVIIHSSQLSFKKQFRDWLKVFEISTAPIIIAHNGQDNFKKLAEVLPEFPSLYVDTTSSSYYRTRYTYDAAGPDKLVFGSDLPYSHPAIELKKYELILTPEDREKVFHLNARRILGI